VSGAPAYFFEKPGSPQRNVDVDVGDIERITAELAPA
jgi:hypothetical protein